MLIGQYMNVCSDMYFSWFDLLPLSICWLLQFCPGNYSENVNARLSIFIYLIWLLVNIWACMLVWPFDIDLVTWCYNFVWAIIWKECMKASHYLTSFLIKKKNGWISWLDCFILCCNHTFQGTYNHQKHLHN